MLCPVAKRRGKIADMPQHPCAPARGDGRLFPGLWEGDLIKEMANASAVDTLVERFLGLLILVRLPYFKQASAASLLQ